LLALVVGVTQAQVGGALQAAILSLCFVALMLGAARPLVAKFLSRREDRPLTQGTLALSIAALLLSALATEAIGVHAIFGAFMLGVIVPHDSRLARELAAKIESLATALLLPAFFAFTGMRTQIGLLSSFGDWLLCGAIVLTATLGKAGGTIAAARLTGLKWRESAALGALMNTRGLMELIVLNIGLEMKVISPTLFAMLVLMALATTLATAPVLNLLGIYPGSRSARLES
jgi:Kef-type K+ transport system membrane component KefB